LPDPSLHRMFEVVCHPLTLVAFLWLPPWEGNRAVHTCFSGEAQCWAQTHPRAVDTTLGWGWAHPWWLQTHYICLLDLSLSLSPTLPPSQYLI
jgi:hypothetical protein